MSETVANAIKYYTEKTNAILKEILVELRKDVVTVEEPKIDEERIARGLKAFDDPTPRPLSKGDWVECNGFLVHVMNPVGNKSVEPDKTFCGLTINGNYDDKFNSDAFTRIDLTEEHLALLNTDGIRFQLDTRSVGGRQIWFVIELYLQTGVYQTHTSVTGRKADAIEACLKSVISRRRLDREMGV